MLRADADRPDVQLPGGRRGANGAAGGAGMPRETLTTSSIRDICYWGSTTGLMMSATKSSPLHAMNTSATT